MYRFHIFLFILLIIQDSNFLLFLVMGQSQDFVVCQPECRPLSRRHESVNIWKFCNDCCTYNFRALNRLYVKETCEINSTSYFFSNVSRDSNFKVTHRHGCLTSIPGKICNFPRIQYLDLENNKITQLPKLSCLRELVILDLRDNQIQVLKAGIFDGMNKLRTIYLFRNEIHTIEMGVFHNGLKKINQVGLDHNNLTEVDVVWALGMTHIFCLFDASNNKITKLTNKSNFTMDPSKTYGPGVIYLNDNSLKILDTKMFDAIGNPLTSLLSTLLYWYIIVDRNPWHCDCRIHPIAALASSTAIRTLMGALNGSSTDFICNTPPNLKGQPGMIHRNLSDFVCNITDSCPSGCLCQDQPEADRMVINCQNAGLAEMPKRLPFHEKLFLNFQNNSIGILPELPYMSRIVHLDISNNNLTNISSEFTSSADKLKYLNLANNRLKYLPETIQKLLSTEIDLSNNMLICSCDNLWLNGWFESKPNIKNRSNITCSTVNGDGRITIVNSQLDEFNCRVSNSVTISIVLGIFSFLSILLLIGIIYFRFEIMASYHIYILPKMKRKWTPEVGEDEQNQHDIFVLVNDEHAPDRLWVIANLIPYFDRNLIKSYISFRDGIIGEVTADANITNIHNSRTVLAVMSKSLLDDPLKGFELNESYCHKIKQGNGQLVLIKREEFNPTLVNNGHIQAMFRLKQFINADDVDLTEKISLQIDRLQN
ncbi:slit homolog 1 protein-like [Patella vulgata]|uniref:slit homolog 1 protein-like n=1 Tax=Patella vulgata TaxID=6465 RepID=UPI0024A86A0E|nr:slit homolog 1 protein-like [Patella vulgata]